MYRAGAQPKRETEPGASVGSTGGFPARCLRPSTTSGLSTGRGAATLTPLQKTLKRALNIDGRDYVIAISPDGLKLVLKGKRKGIELKWEALISGDAALAAALRASVGRLGPPTSHFHSR